MLRVSSLRNNFLTPKEKAKLRLRIQMRRHLFHTGPANRARKRCRICESELRERQKKV